MLQPRDRLAAHPDHLLQAAACSRSTGQSKVYAIKTAWLGLSQNKVYPTIYWILFYSFWLLHRSGQARESALWNRKSRVWDYFCQNKHKLMLEWLPLVKFVWNTEVKSYHTQTPTEAERLSSHRFKRGFWSEGQFDVTTQSYASAVLLRKEQWQSNLLHFFFCMINVRTPLRFGESRQDAVNQHFTFFVFVIFFLL